MSCLRLSLSKFALSQLELRFSKNERSPERTSLAPRNHELLILCVELSFKARTQLVKFGRVVTQRQQLFLLSFGKCLLLLQFLVQARLAGLEGGHLRTKLRNLPVSFGKNQLVFLLLALHLDSEHVEGVARRIRVSVTCICSYLV